MTQTAAPTPPPTEGQISGLHPKSPSQHKPWLPQPHPQAAGTCCKQHHRGPDRVLLDFPRGAAALPARASRAGAQAAASHLGTATGNTAPRRQCYFLNKTKGKAKLLPPKTSRHRMGFPPKLAPGWCNILLSPKTPDSRGRGGPTVRARTMETRQASAQTQFRLYLGCFYHSAHFCPIRFATKRAGKVYSKLQNEKLKKTRSKVCH